MTLACNRMGVVFCSDCIQSSTHAFLRGVGWVVGVGDGRVGLVGLVLYAVLRACQCVCDFHIGVMFMAMFLLGVLKTFFSNYS